MATLQLLYLGKQNTLCQRHMFFHKMYLDIHQKHYLPNKGKGNTELNILLNGKECVLVCKLHCLNIITLTYRSHKSFEV